MHNKSKKLSLPIVLVIDAVLALGLTIGVVSTITSSVNTNADVNEASDDAEVKQAQEVVDTEIEPLEEEVYFDETIEESEDEISAEPEDEVIIESNSLALKFADKFSEDVVQTETTYTSPNISISIDEHKIGSGNNLITYYVADIYLANIDCFQTYLANDKFGTENLQFVLDMDIDSGAILAMSGDYYGARADSTEMRNGTLYRDVKTNMDICVMYDDGSIVAYSPEEFNTDDVVNNGAIHIWSFGPTLVKDGQIVEKFNDTRDIGVKNPRGALGYYEPGHYCFVLVDGRRPGHSEGMTFDELANVFYELGCKTAYNLDGGGSATLTFNDSLVDIPSGSGREISDALIIKEVSN